jgi:hypothetical protein
MTALIPDIRLTAKSQTVKNHIEIFRVFQNHGEGTRTSAAAINAAAISSAPMVSRVEKKKERKSFAPKQFHGDRMEPNVSVCDGNDRTAIVPFQSFVLADETQVTCGARLNVAADM